MDKKEKRISNEKDIPERKELEREADLFNREDRNYPAGSNRVDYPDIEGELGMSEFESDISQQIGNFGDQVMLGSPAAEAGESGLYGLKNIIKKADKKLKARVKKDADQE